MTNTASKVFLIFAGAGMSAENVIPASGKTIGDYQSIREKPIAEGYTYSELVSFPMLVKKPDLFWQYYETHADEWTSAVPHFGYDGLLQLVKDHEYFIVTSNVDGAFVRAGFDSNRILEIHGHIDTRQCNCSIRGVVETEHGWWRRSNNNDNSVIICKHCRATRWRPNVLLFDDLQFSDRRRQQQHFRFATWFRRMRGRSNNKQFVFLEIGVGRVVMNLYRMAQKYYNCISSKSSRRYLYVNASLDFEEKDWQVHVPIKASELSVATLAPFL
jgi:NAD-dependent SIR2 family protein deacetylase